ncbi:MAG: hypothetical protein ACRCZS_09170, partial [Chroococcidiopsis sp.]
MSDFCRSPIFSIRPGELTDRGSIQLLSTANTSVSRGFSLTSTRSKNYPYSLYLASNASQLCG